MAMNSVFDVAKYILRKQGPMSTMKLQKLVYYCQAWSLAWDGYPLFDEEFEAWANGPVCTELFDKCNGSFLVDGSMFEDTSTYQFTVDQKETMNKVLKYYGKRKLHWLRKLIHEEDPWKMARTGYPSGASCNVVISKESMLQYYGEL